MNQITKRFQNKLNIASGRVDMTHGAGGRAMNDLIEQLFHKHLHNDYLDQKNDQAILPAPAAHERLVISTDSHVVSPSFSPVGILGRCRCMVRSMMLPCLVRARFICLPDLFWKKDLPLLILKRS